MQQLPLIASTRGYRVGAILDGTPYIFDLHWNGREAAWYMDLLAEDETVIRAGMKLVLGARLGSQSAREDFPGGAFIVMDLSGTGIDAGFDDLGVRVQVWYMTQAEIDAATADDSGAEDNVTIPVL